MPFDNSNELPHLVRLCLSANILDVQYLGDITAEEDVMTAPGSLLFKTDCKRQLDKIIERNVAEVAGT